MPFASRLLASSSSSSGNNSNAAVVVVVASAATATLTCLLVAGTLYLALPPRSHPASAASRSSTFSTPAPSECSSCAECQTKVATRPQRPRFYRIKAYLNWNYYSGASGTGTEAGGSGTEVAGEEKQTPSSGSESSLEQGGTEVKATSDEPRSASDGGANAGATGNSEGGAVSAEATSSPSGAAPDSKVSGISEEAVVDSKWFGGKEYAEAVRICRERVAFIAKECKADNRKFRDIEFDLTDTALTLLDLKRANSKCKPTDVLRVSDLYSSPQFFVGKPDPNDIVQGAAGDCWFLSALGSLSTVDGMIERVCVGHDDEVGVYGFVFRKHGRWVPVVVDDLLYTEVPSFESLGPLKRLLYKNERADYRSTALKGGEGLLFARSGKEGETWVPLIEKAFAKLHGSYEALNGGYMAEALEDMTGGVSENWALSDILCPSSFWDTELLLAGTDRLFDLSLRAPSTSRSGARRAPYVDGLIGSHAYTVVKAKEIGGKKFVVVRNPWGSTGFKWTGKWGDGSKEWMQEGKEGEGPGGKEVLRELGHTLGDTGTFVMEYSDVLEQFEYIQRTLLLDSSWNIKQVWATVPPKPDGYPWSYGELVFKFTLSQAATVHLILSQIDTRSFDAIPGRGFYTLDFALVKRGTKEVLAESPQSAKSKRSVSVGRIELEEGEYAVYPRIRRNWNGTYGRPIGYYKKDSGGWNQRKLERVLTQRAEALSIVTGTKPDSGRYEKHIPKNYQSELNPKPAPSSSKSSSAKSSSSSSSKSKSSSSSSSSSKSRSAATTTSAKSNSTPAPAKPATTPAKPVKLDKNGKPVKMRPMKPQPLSMTELALDPEDREFLVIGLQIYFQDPARMAASKEGSTSEEGGKAKDVGGEAKDGEKVTDGEKAKGGETAKCGEGEKATEKNEEQKKKEIVSRLVAQEPKECKRTYKIAAEVLEEVPDQK